MQKLLFRSHISRTLAHLTYASHRTNDTENEKGRSVLLQWQYYFFYRFTHATSYNMSIILRCWYVAVLITFSYAMFLWIFSLIIHVTWLCQPIDCFFCLLTRSFLSQLNLLVLFSNNQWINIFKFIPNSIDFHSIRVTRCRCCRSPVVW